MGLQSASTVVSVSQHGRERAHARSTVGSGLCEHGRRRSRCKECGGGSICEHGRRWGGICEHGRRALTASECGGSGICEHGRHALTAISAAGLSASTVHLSASTVVSALSARSAVGLAICEHGRLRYRCKECGGSQSASTVVRSRCKECGGSQICEHGRRRCECKECGGSQICEHGRVRSKCKECGAVSNLSTVVRVCKECRDEESRPRQVVLAVSSSLPAVQPTAPQSSSSN